MDGKLGTVRTRNMSGDVIAFIRIYRARHQGDTPSLGELAIAVQSTKPAVSRMLDRLERDGALARLPGPPRRKRLIVLPDEKARALALLRAMGFIVDNDVHLHDPPAPSVTDCVLPPPPPNGQNGHADKEQRHGGEIAEEDE